jgi:FlaA1/EpsC-like NDP-sugar epimerase
MLFKKHIDPAWYAASDYLMTALAWGFFFVLRRRLLYEPIALEYILSDERFWLGLFLVPLGWLGLYALTGSYLSIYKKSRLAEFTKTFTGCIIGTVVLFFVFLLDDTPVSYSYYYAAFFLLFILNLFFTFSGRAILLSKAKQHIRRGLVRFNALVVGQAEQAARIMRDNEKKLQNEGYVVCGYIPLTDMDKNPGHRLTIAGSLASLETVIDKQNIQMVILATDKNEPAVQEKLIERLSEKDVAIKMQPSTLDILSGSVRASNVLGAVLIDLKTDLMPDWQQNIKRLIDFSVALAGGVLLLPLCFTSHCGYGYHRPALFSIRRNALATKASHSCCISSGQCVWMRRRMARHFLLIPISGLRNGAAPCANGDLTNYPSSGTS